MSIALLENWLQSRSGEALPASLRDALVVGLQAPGATEGMPDDWPVLVDTLQALVGLSAESDVLLAALLFGMPGLQSVLKP